jgi:uncharacterized protein YjbI with pentapeptide repeats
MPYGFAKPVRRVVNDKPLSGQLPGTDYVARINSISQNARTTWFALIGSLVFASITLFGIRDVDFFSLGRNTSLPLLSFSVPVAYFFAAGGTLVTATYVYLHLYLELLWDALGRAPARIGKEPLSEQIFAWEVSEWALRRRDRLRKTPSSERSAEHRALAWVSNAMSVFFVWSFGPVVIFFFWWRSMPAHIDWITVVLASLFSFSLWTGWRSWHQAARLLGGKAPLPPTPSLKSGSALLGSIIILVTASLVATGSSWWPAQLIQKARSEDVKDTKSAVHFLLDWPAQNLLVRADLVEASVVERPTGWLDRDEAEKVSRAEWAKREEIHYKESFGYIPARDAEAEFQAAFAAQQQLIAGSALPQAEEAYRKSWAREKGLDVGAPFPPVPARNVEGEFRLAWKERRASYLEAFPTPILDDRNLQNGLLSRAFMPGVVLRQANLQGANMVSATIEGGDLWQAQLEGAVLDRVSAQGANFMAAKLQKAQLSYANLDGANFRTAKLQGANLARAKLSMVDLGWASLDRADVSWTIIRDSNLEHAQFPGANLGKAKLENVDLTETNFENAILQGASIRGTAEKLLDLNSANLRNSKWANAALRFVDMKAVHISELEKFDFSFGDASVILPVGYVHPCQWADTVLSDPEYFGRWRGWLERVSKFPILYGVENYVSIPPPPGCGP